MAPVFIYKLHNGPKIQARIFEVARKRNNLAIFSDLSFETFRLVQIPYKFDSSSINMFIIGLYH